MLHLLSGGRFCPLPSAVEAQKKISAATFELVSTGSTMHHETIAAARAMTQLNLSSAEETTGIRSPRAHDTIDDGFDTIEDASKRAEDRFYRALLSAGQLSATYAEFVDASVERACPTASDE
ncbi:hypothetical protein HWV23_09210 [Natronomonas halophila]|uniref:hypothetical protein n=1 Tax=Natronomonas halophila TaxID=2747817 RepID=UPI0015B3DBF8|nr:hypothetical protein [Natronomonas halophila]QLD85896.1 hypothetical protein HWV23_09210 [Natronomonas halophila]